MCHRATKFFSIWEPTKSAWVKFSASILIIKPKQKMENNATIIIFCGKKVGLPNLSNIIKILVIKIFCAIPNSHKLSGNLIHDEGPLLETSSLFVSFR